LAVQFLGAAQRLEVKVGSKTLTALLPDSEGAGSMASFAATAQPGQRLALHWAQQHMVMLDA
jgi:hypothetical protein